MMQISLKSVLVSRLVISMRKEVVGFEGLYEVDTGGHVYSSNLRQDSRLLVAGRNAFYIDFL